MFNFASKIIKIVMRVANLPFLFLFFFSVLSFSQNREKIIVSGTITNKSNQPIEYALISFTNIQTGKVSGGGSSDTSGKFAIDVLPGKYTIKIEAISYKSISLKDKEFSKNNSLGTISLDEDVKQLEAVVVKTEKAAVEIKLDKKVYNIGKDLAVKGGTASDILQNIPSVSLDSDGNVSLRGNENVKILIDGRPSNAINVADALRTIPADALDRVEVVTNPSARYDAEGGAGILNIVLKKGKTNGLNGTIMATVGTPDNEGLNVNLNFKSDDFNVFTTQGFNYRNNPGNAKLNSRYLDDFNNTKSYIDESRESERINRTYNGSFGLDWFLTKSLTWTNIVNYRKSNGDNTEDIDYVNYDINRNYNFTNFRNNTTETKSQNVEYTTSFLQKFSTSGHQLSVDGNFSVNRDSDIATILKSATNDTTTSQDNSKNIQKQNRNLVQVDYVLPFAKDARFEAGYRGSFIDNTTDYQVLSNGTLLTNFTNILNYKEKINAGYVQLGNKFNKISVFAGLRFEDSNIQINQLTSQDFRTKKYNNFFPSATLGYEIDDKSSVMFSYSKRINRPRGRQLNPFSNYSSNINLFQGNPDLNPSITDVVEAGYTKKVSSKLNFSTSVYYNATKNTFQMIRRESGDFVGTTPVMLNTFINLANEYRVGLDVSFGYNPYKWWKINGGFNAYNVKTEGVYTYTNYLNQEVTKDFGFNTNTWNAKINSRITLPYKIEWQTNMNYDAMQKNAQGKTLDVFAMNLGFSKDVLKDKATLALNVNDVFNSRKRRMETYVPYTVETYQSMQFRRRQVTLSFTYRFNQNKSDKEKTKTKRDDNGGDDFQMQG